MARVWRKPHITSLLCPKAALDYQRGWGETAGSPGVRSAHLGHPVAEFQAEPDESRLAAPHSA